MSDSAHEKAPAAAPVEGQAASDETKADPEPAEAEVKAPTEMVGEPKKGVTFEKNELTFDEAQAEIDAIKARAGQARESLRATSSPCATTYGASYGGSSSYSGYEEDTPKSKNMLSHLNTHSAMLNYKVQAARSLVRKQEDLLRNLARMRENMERSECELYKASDYYSPSRPRPYGYFERRAESAPFVSRRPQVREPSPLESLEVTELRASTSDKAASPAPLSVTSHISNPAVSSNDYQLDEDFEHEMAAIRKRVADLSKQANEAPTSRYTSYDYLGGYGDIYGISEPRYESSMPEGEVQ